MAMGHDIGGHALDPFLDLVVAQAQRNGVVIADVVRRAMENMEIMAELGGVGDGERQVANPVELILGQHFAGLLGHLEHPGLVGTVRLVGFPTLVGYP
jgi:hypothetical protein